VASLSVAPAHHGVAEQVRTGRQHQTRQVELVSRHRILSSRGVRGVLRDVPKKTPLVRLALAPNTQDVCHCSTRTGWVSAPSTDRGYEALLPQVQCVQTSTPLCVKQCCPPRARRPASKEVLRPTWRASCVATRWPSPCRSVAKECFPRTASRHHGCNPAPSSAAHESTALRLACGGSTCRARGLTRFGMPSWRRGPRTMTEAHANDEINMDVLHEPASMTSCDGQYCRTLPWVW